ncbi:MAG: hypothetical protein LBT59_08690 [Clostridiales bacterium]|jgi:hypothetical protein|nr:hypothetical protein [Clostridiales bacterium]
MGTRALYGYKRNGEQKISYCHCDGYPSGLGVTMLDFCRNSDLGEMNSLFDRIELVEEMESVKGKKLLDLPWSYLTPNSDHSEEWYMYDMADFTDYQYKYIINLDTDCLERWDSKDFGSTCSLVSEVNLRDLAEIDKAITKWDS